MITDLPVGGYPARALHALPLAERDPVLIGLTGAAGAGKDTAGYHLVHSYGCESAAFADAVRDHLASDLDDMGVDYAVLTEPALKDRPLAGLAAALSGTITPRRLMQSFGDAGRGVHPDYWVHLLACRLGLAAGGTPVHDRIVITDVRYPNEADWIRRRGGVLLRIVRDGAASPLEPAAAQHSSEQHWAQLPADCEIANPGTSQADLRDTVDVAMAQLGIWPRLNEHR